jgi:hypothetical protein
MDQVIAYMKVAEKVAYRVGYKNVLLIGICGVTAILQYS